MSTPKPKKPKILVIPNTDFLINAGILGVESTLTNALQKQNTQTSTEQRTSLPPTERISEIAKVMGEMGVALWRAQQALEKDESNEPVDRKMYRALEALQAAMSKAGVEIVDRIGTNLSLGHYRDIVVVATEQSADVQQEIITETIKPAVQWRHNFPGVAPEVILIQPSEVVTKSPLTQSAQQ